MKKEQLPCSSRRQFIQTMAQGATFVVAVKLLPIAGLATADDLPGGRWRPDILLSLDGTGLVTFTCHRSEMGQKVRVSLAQVIADELEADWDRIRVEQADGDARYGDQNTDGSQSVRMNFARLRQVGATVRLALETAAATIWKVPVSECLANMHVVTHTPSGKTLAYGQLAEVAASLPLPAPDQAKLKSRDQWKYIGRTVTDGDLLPIVSGRTVFGFDVNLPGMRTALIARPPVLFGSVKSFDKSAAMKVGGVEHVLELPALAPPAAFKALGGVAVVATDAWSAIKGRRALDVQWAPSVNDDYDSGEFAASLLKMTDVPGNSVRNEGDVEAALSSGNRIVSATYYVPHLAQAPMEPPCATARFEDGKVEMWVCTQSPQAVQESVSGALGIKKEAVTVHVTALGGAFGRKAKADFAVEAAILAREVGHPVKVMWTREDDIQHGYYHTVSAQRFDAALDAGGRAIAWRQRAAFPSILTTFNPAAKVPIPPELRGFIDNPFDIPNMRMEVDGAGAHVRIGWLRSVTALFFGFGAQSFACELAVAAGRDPKDYLLELIGPPRNVDLGKEVAFDNYGDPIDTHPLDTARLRNVIEIAARRAQWGRKMTPGTGLGIAACRSFSSYVATVVEVEVRKDGSLLLPAVYMAIDAGTVVNPDHVRAQCEGGAVYGLSCALAQVTARNGAVVQSNFHDYPVARINDAPKVIDVHIVESDAPPAGVGEAPVPPFAPALCNAIHAATGRRIRVLPIDRKALA
ncbi:MAG: molybdopterin cofactor-binding domain-containing protein [Dehalococcoidia bacterium]